MRGLTLAFLLVLAGAGLQAQTEDLTEQPDKKDRSVNAMFNRQDPSTTLQSGGAFFISNPSLPVDIAIDKAYYKPEWEELVIRMVDGNTATVQGRYRLVDQRFEVKQEDGIYEMRNTVMRDAQLGDDYFILLPLNGQLEIFQAHYRDDTYAVLTHHYTEWQDPPEQKLYDTSERKRTLKRKDKLYLLTPFGVEEAESKGEVLRQLFVFKGSEPYTYVKKQKLNVKEPADLAKLLRYVQENDLVHPEHKQ